MAADQVRTITIRSRTDGVTETTAQVNKLAVSQDNLGAVSETAARKMLTLQGATDRYQRSLVLNAAASQQFETAQRSLITAQQRYIDTTAKQAGAANDNADGWHITGLEVATTTNHLKQAAVALYALSPAFRELVNPAITASVRATGSALAAMGPVAGSAAAAALRGFSPLLATLGRVLLPIVLVKDAFEAMSAVTELGAKKLAEFNVIADNAAGAGVSTDFFQRQAKGADDFGLKADSATAALKKFNDVSTPALGGSAFDQRLDQLTKAGNFVNNTGVAAVRSAVTTEEKYRAAVDLIGQAMESGQRLAAIDLASRFLPPDMLQRLRANGQLLTELQQTADSIKPADIVSAEQIGYATALKARLDDANEIIANGLKPLQKDLTQLGLNYQESWVSIKEAMAAGVTTGNSLYSALKGIPDIFAQAGSSPFWGKLSDFLSSHAPSWLSSTPEQAGIVLKGQPGFVDAGSGSPAHTALAGQLSNPNAVRLAMQQSADIASRIYGDASKNPTGAAGSKDTNDAVDRALNSLRRHTEQQIADTNAMSLGVGAQARFRAEAAQTAAVQANGGKITAEQAKEFENLKKRAEDAAIGLERAKISSNIQFGRDTAFLTPADAAIASQLKGIYPQVADALNSAEAAQLRFNNTLREIGALGQEVNRSFVVDFQQQLRGGATAFQALQTAGTNALGKIADKLSSMAADDLWSAAFGGKSGGGGLLGSLFNGILGGGANPVVPGATMSTGLGAAFPTFHTGGMVGFEGGPSRYVHSAYFDDAPRFHTGGIAGDEVPIIAKKGEGVFTPGQMAAMGGQGGQPIVFNNDFRGVDASVVAGLQSQLNQVKRQLATASQAAKASRLLRPNAS